MEIVKPNFKGDPDTAKRLRDLANEVENGSVRDVVVVWQSCPDGHYVQYGSWEDRWRLLGALEYAKQAVYRAS